MAEIPRTFSLSQCCSLFVRDQKLQPETSCTTPLQSCTVPSQHITEILIAFQQQTTVPSCQLKECFFKPILYNAATATTCGAPMGHALVCFKAYSTAYKEQVAQTTKLRTKHRPVANSGCTFRVGNVVPRRTQPSQGSCIHPYNEPPKDDVHFPHATPSC